MSFQTILTEIEASVMTTADAAEGVVGFLEKRAPVYPETVGRDPDVYPWWRELDYE